MIPKVKNVVYDVYGVPRVVIPYEIYERCLGWMNASHNEVSWRGLADWNKEEFRITEVFLPSQNASAAHVHVPHAKEGGDFGKWISDCIRQDTYTNEEGECRYKWHMHKHPGDAWDDLFESSQDETNTEQFGSRDVTWMMVGRAVESGKFRVGLEIFNPYRLKIEHIPTFVEYKGEYFKVSEPGEYAHIGELEFDVSPFTALYSVPEHIKTHCNIVVKEKRIKEYVYSYGVPYAGNYNFIQVDGDDDTYSPEDPKKDEGLEQSDFFPGYYSFFPSGEDISFPEQNEIISPQQENALVVDNDRVTVKNLGTKKRQKKLSRRAVYKIKKTMEFSQLIPSLPKNRDAYAVLQKEDGLVSGSIHFSIGPWNIMTEPIVFDVMLPEDKEIRRSAKSEVKEKVSDTHGYRRRRRKKEHRGTGSFLERGTLFKGKL